MSDEQKKAVPGWYVDKRWPDEERRWDGTRWLDDWRPAAKESPAGYMLIGAILLLVAGALGAVGFAVSDVVGWIVVAVGGTVAGAVFNIGVVGKAVEVGVRAARR